MPVASVGLEWKRAHAACKRDSAWPCMMCTSSGRQKVGGQAQGTGIAGAARKGEGCGKKRFGARVLASSSSLS